MVSWWKILCIACLTFALIGGFLLPVPALPILHESIRNLYYHVPMWFTMMFLMSVSLYHSIKFLSSNQIRHDLWADLSARISMVFGTLGLLTGMLWARHTWTAWWVNDTKLNGSAITMLAYLAYFVLRNSMDEPQKRARISAVYNVFAYVFMLVFIMVLPRLNDSLHPGNGGNPGFVSYDLDNTMRMVFYPAVLGFILLSWWILRLRIAMSDHKTPTE